MDDYESYYLDGKDEEHANWLRYVNTARNRAEQNLLSFQHQGNIYFCTIKHVSPGTELLVWYGEEYVKQLGLSVASISDNGKEICISMHACTCVHVRACTYCLYIFPYHYLR